MNRRKAMLSGALLMTALVAGCSGEQRGTPSVTTPITAPSTSGSDKTLPRHGAPKVDDPLDTSYFRQEEPCESITDAEMTEFFGEGVTAKPDLQGAAGPECVWDTGLGRAGIQVIFPTVDQSGLSGIYANRNKGGFFEELPPADGYPAVAYTSGQRIEGECTVRVGTSDTESVDVTLALSENKVGQIDPCEAAHEVAATVVGNIKERN